MALFAAEHETIEGVGRALRSGQTTSVEVLEKCFDRIEEWESRVKAWVRVDRDGAIAQARALDEELANGQCRGPLHGVPFGIKDIIDVQGLPTAAGFGPWSDRVAERDATLVSALRCAGAVILGKTVTTQFAWIDPPSTRNPWDLNRTPGGSSSGSAAAVALGMCLGALGTQTGGSIIRPAAFCGVAGFKPSWHFFSDLGILPFAPSLDHPGPIARTVRDLWLTVQELAAFDHAASAPSSGNDTPETVETQNSYLDEPFERTLKLLRPRGFFDRRAEPVMLAAFEQALDILVDAGAEVVEMPDDAFAFEAMIGDHRLIMAAQSAAVHEERLAAHRDKYAPHIRALVEEGLSVPLTRYIRAKFVHAQAGERIGDLMEGIDAIVTPAAIGPAPDTSTTGNPCFQSPFSYLGWPAVTFPIGLSPEGLPMAIQMAGDNDPLFPPDHLLKTAAWCESVIRRASRAGSD